MANNNDLKFIPFDYYNDFPLNSSFNMDLNLSSNSSLFRDSTNISVNEIPFSTTRTPSKDSSPLDVLSTLDLSFEDEEEENELYRVENVKVNKVLDEIEKKHPGVMATLKAYKIPQPICKMIVKRVIRLTLLYKDK